MKVVHVYPVPWDVTTTFGAGTANAPQAIASVYHQLDHSHPFQSRSFDPCFLPESSVIQAAQRRHARESRAIIHTLNHDGTLSNDQRMHRDAINEASQQLNNQVFADTLPFIQAGDPIILCGGEHGVGVGYLRALAKVHASFSILHIDAHLDCRPAYFGYDYSHASVLTHYANMPQTTHITSVGIRDYDASEPEFATHHPHTTWSIFYDYAMHQALFEGQSWHHITQSIVSTLTDPVVISLDVDGLIPYHCLHTGTPVVGGMTYNQLAYMLDHVHRARHVIGAELVEVGAPNETPYDATIGARLIQLLAGVVAHPR